MGYNKTECTKYICESVCKNYSILKVFVSSMASNSFSNKISGDW